MNVLISRHSSQHIIICHFYSSYPRVGEVLLHVVLICISLMFSMFSHAYRPRAYICSLEKGLLRFFWPIFKLGCYFHCWVFRILYSLNTVIKIMTWKYFLPFSVLIFFSFLFWVFLGFFVCLFLHSQYPIKRLLRVSYKFVS